MAASSEADLSLESVRRFMVECGGKVTNRELVKHFKAFLTTGTGKDDARKIFKDYVNTLATIKLEDGEKYLVLRRRFYMDDESNPEQTLSPRLPPPYRPPPDPYNTPPSSSGESSRRSSADVARILSPGDESDGSAWSENSSSVPPPPVPPRGRKGSKSKLSVSSSDDKENSSNDAAENEDQMSISVKERTQKFNKIASETELLKISNTLSPMKKKSLDEDDTASVTSVTSVTSLEPKVREFLVKSSQADYHALTKLLQDNPRLAKCKDPVTGFTALHWASKLGNQDMVKLIAGKYQADVNIKSHGGYTPLHMAAQFQHRDVFDLLVKGYGADPQIRDHSGRKPHQYQTCANATVSADTCRKIKARRRNSERDLSFLRIGSLNVRVRKTTEAFGSLLHGVVGHSHNNDEHHGLRKSWGSADSLHDGDRKLMPPPKFPVKKRKTHVGKSPNPSPSTGRRNRGDAESNDSDSDGACGFGTDWQHTSVV